MMGSHRDIAEDLNEYRVRIKLDDHRYYNACIIIATYAIDLVRKLACNLDLK